MNSGERLREEAKALDDESSFLDYLLKRIDGTDSKFEAIPLILFFNDNPKIKGEFVHVLKQSKIELKKHSDIKKSLADIYQKISTLQPEKPCPDCGQIMYLKPIDKFRQVYSCSTCSRKEFFKDGELDSASSSEVKDNPNDAEGTENKTRKRCPKCGNVDIGEMFFATNKNLNSSEIEVECRKCGEIFKVSVSPRK